MTRSDLIAKFIDMLDEHEGFPLYVVMTGGADEEERSYNKDNTSVFEFSRAAGDFRKMERVDSFTVKTIDEQYCRRNARRMTVCMNFRDD